jgi:methyl-accepting chemotaxis protein
METFSTQRRFGLYLFASTLIIVLLGAALGGAGVFALLPATLGEGYVAVLSTVQGMERTLLERVAGIYAVMSIFIIGAVMLLHLFYSHRIAGPVYRLGRESEAIGQGRLTGNLRFRRKDNLTDIGYSLNQAATRYRVRVETIKDHLSLIDRQADTAATLIQQEGKAPALEQTANEMKTILKNVSAVLSEVRT